MHIETENKTKITPEDLAALPALNRAVANYLIRTGEWELISTRSDQSD